MKQIFTRLAAMVLLFALTGTAVFAQSGIYESYAIMNINGAGNTYYDLNATTGNPDFQGASLGTFGVGQTLVITGGQNKTFKCAPCNILNGYINYRVYLTASPTGSFTSINLPFGSNLGTGCGGNDQVWETTGNSTNVLSGLAAGNYTIEVYSHADYDGCGTGTNYANNSGANYKATFTVAPVTVSSTGGTAFATYTTLASAITAINSGTHTGTITCNVLAGYTETAPAGGYSITATGTLANPIKFQKSGAGANPTFTANGTLTAGALNDAIFKIIGGDYITIDGFSLQENASNTITAAGTNNMTEWGVALLYATTTNGAQNNTIQNCSISLNRTYTNTFGIYSNVRHSATAVTTTADITSAAGANSNNKIYSNTISNVNMGIAFIGSGTAANQDAGNDIGGTSSGTGNTITNWGGAAAVSSFVSNTGTSYCIFMNHQVGDNVSYNTITSASVSGTSVTFVGIRKDYTTASATGTFTSNITNNTITMTSGFTSGTFQCILNQGLTALSTATINITNNTLLNCAITGASSSSAFQGIINSSVPGVLNINNNIIRGTSSTATTGGFTAISNTGAVTTTANIKDNQIGNASGNAITFSAATNGSITGISCTAIAAACALTITGNDFRGFTHSVAGTSSHTYITWSHGASATDNINSNTFTNLNVNTTGSITFLTRATSMTATGIENVNNNSIVTAFNKGGAGGTITLFGANASSVAGSVMNNTGNNFSNITVTGATTIAGWSNTEGGAPAKTITGNIFSNWVGGSSAITVISSDFGGNGTTVSTNTISGITGTGAITGISIGSSNGGTAQTAAGNSISSLTSSGTGGTVLGITGGSSSVTTLNINGSNSISSLSSTAASVIGINITAGSTVNVSSNLINTLSTSNSSGAVRGIATSSGTTINISKNKIYDVLANGTGSSTAYGINLNGGTTNNVTNNLISDIRIPAGINTNSTPLAGINITSVSTTDNIYYNTIYIGATTTTGALLYTAGLFASTTPTVNLRNNMIINMSTPVGSGAVAAAYYRSGTSLTTYASTSNNNFLYAGASGPTRLIFFDITNSDQSMAAFKSRVGPTRDAASVSETITPATYFQSTTGSSANFLKYDLATATQAESGGAAISGFTDDYAGTTRNASTPDIGAWELAGTGADFTAPTITYTPLGNGGVGSNQTLTATVADASGVPTSGANQPTLYWKLNSGSYTALTGASIGSNQYTFSFGSATTTAGDVISYYIVAQDNASTPNVGASPSAGASGLTANPPAASTPPTTPSTFTAIGSISGDLTVCASGCTYTSLTNAGGAFADINAKAVTGNINLQIAGDLTLEAGTNALNAFSSPYTIKIYPTGSARIISGALASATLIKLNGADRVTVDGSIGGTGTDKSLTITNTSSTSPTSIGLISLGTAAGATDNAIKNCNISTGTNGATSYGISIGGTTGGSAGDDNDNTTIQNNNVTKAYYGIYASANSTGTNNNLIISQNTIGSLSVGNEIQFTGIYVQQSTTGSNISNNTITNILTTGSVDPIGLNLSTGCINTTVNANNISGVNTTNTGGYGGRGIQINTGNASSNITISNNMISDIKGSGWSSLTSDAILGIAIGNVTSATGGINLYSNSVNLGSGTFAGNASGTLSAVLFISSGATSLNIKNNIFATNLVNSAVTAKTYAIYSAAANTAFTSINNNDYYVSGTQGVLGFLTSDRTDLAGIVSGFGQNANSLNKNPNFTSASDLHINSAITSYLESAGATGTGITVDYDGTTRNSPPDIGADEGTFTAPVANDMQATAFITPVSGGSVVASTSYTPTASFTNAGTAAQTAVTVRYRIVGPSPALTEVYNDTKSIASIAAGATSSVTFTTTSLSTAGTYTMYAKAELAGDALTINDEISATFTVDAPLCGVYAIGASQPVGYQTLTQALNKLNTLGVSAACGTGVTFSLQSDYAPASETYPIVINAFANASATHTLTISPAGGVSKTIGGASVSTAVIKLNGADYVIIDGVNSGGASLTISNTSTSSSTAAVWLSSLGTGAGATNNTIKNCNISLGSTTVTNYAINIGGTSIGIAGDDNDNNTIQGNTITKAAYGIYVSAPTMTVDGLNIASNIIGPAAAGTDNISLRGIYLSGVSLPAVTGNTLRNIIGPVGVLGTVSAIYLAGTVTNATVSQNTITNISTSGDDGFGSPYDVYAVYAASSCTGLILNRNTITSVHNDNSSGYAARGVYLASGSATLTNNMISDVYGYADPDATFAYQPVGIYIASNLSTISLYHNSINLYGTHAGLTGATIEADVYIGTSVTGLDFRNNIFVSSYDNTSSTTDKAYAIYSASAATAFTNLDFNDYYVTSPALVGYLGADQSTMALWKTATGKETDGQNFDPKFISSTNLHINTTTPTIVESLGTPIVAVTTDIDGDTRNATTPDIGADEGTFVAIVNKDMAPTAMVYPTNGGYVPTATVFTPQATFINNGLLTQNSVTVRYRIQSGASTVYNNTKVIATLAPGASITVSFSPTTITTLPTAGTYTVLLNSQLSGDQVTTNDLFTGSLVASAPLCGTYAVGASHAAPFNTITNAIGALNGVGASCAVTFSLDAATYPSETYPITLTAYSGASATNKLTIKPATGVSPSISADNASAIFKLNGADYITIDGSNTVGGTTRDLTITNTNTSGTGSVIWLASTTTPDGATNNTIKNCTITGGSSDLGFAGILSSGSSAGAEAEAANSNNTYQNNAVSKVLYGIAVQGGAATDNTSTITGNSVGSTTATSKIGYNGIYASNQQNLTISGNTIAGVTTSTTNTTSGIFIGGIISTAAITGNSVSDVKNTNIDGYGSNGIELASTSTAANLTLANNFIYDIASVGYSGGASDEDNGYGIIAASGGGYKLYYNTINLTTNQSGGITAAVNIYSDVTTAASIDIRNNIIANTQTTGTRYGIYSSATSSVFSNIDYNDYYVTSGNLGYIAATTRTTLSAMQTGFGGNTHSIAADPKFISATNLHINTAVTSPADGAATPIAGITTDYDGGTRDATHPDLGADEFTPPTVTDIGIASLASPVTGTGCYTATENFTVTVTNYGNVAWDFSAVPASITASVSGAATGSYPLTISNNTLNGGVALAAGASMNVPLGTLDMRLPGTYTFNASISATGDALATNDAMPSTARTSINPVVTLGSNTPVCNDGTLIQLTANSTGGNNTIASSGSKTETTPLSIPDGDIVTGATSVISLSGTSTVTAASTVQVTLNITHGFDSDLDIYLVGPSACGALELTTDNGSSGLNYTNTILLTGASTSVTLGSAPFTGTYAPEGTVTTGPAGAPATIPTTALSGCPVNGNWSLRMFDDVSDDVGTLSNWSLSVSSGSGNYSDAFSGTPGTISSVTYSGANNAQGITTVSGAPAGGPYTYQVITTDANGCASKPVTTSVTVNPATSYYTDADADGYGSSAASPILSCSAVSGSVTNNTDCNDALAAVHPGATEICNGVDDDCAGGVDNGLTFTNYYTDADGDGYGTGSATSLCASPGAGYSTNNTDCDDTNGAIHVNGDFYTDADGDGYGTGSLVSVCYSGTGTPSGYATNNTDCDDANIAIHSPVTYYVDGDGDGYGSASAASYCQLTAPSGYSANSTDCNDLIAAVNPGASEVCNGVDDDCDGATDSADPSVTGEPTWYADADGDGFGDASSTATQCGAPLGYVANATDCNDADNTVHTPQLYYVDGDGDGYGSMTTAMLCNSTAPAGYATNNTDCDDANAAIHSPVTYYLDGDGDGYGSTTSSTYCQLTAPAGYSADNTDCDDADNTVHTPQLYYVDGDGDGYGSTTTAMLCSSTATVGYATNNTDCDDANAAIHVNGNFYTDADGDGYGIGSLVSVCYSGTGTPAGYSTNNTDCDDANAAINSPVTYYVDADGDGYGSATTGSYCQLTAPAGYSTDNTDCNDADAAVHTPQVYYTDADGDGYGAGSAQMLCSATTPTGYSVNDTDCNDADEEVHPGATDLCNGTDDDCDASVDEDATFVNYYVDADADGYGDASAAPESSCSPVSGSVTNNMDCNDADNTVHTPQLYYVDADGDGYGSATTAMLCSSTAPGGYATNNTDCDDTNAAIYVNGSFYTDADGDGYGTGSLISVCYSGTGTPSGYSTNNTDCDDTNAAIHVNGNFYTDADGDGYGTGSLVSVCYSGTGTPVGYSTNNTDCDDANAAINSPVTYYVDGDGDGYGSSVTGSYCQLTAPAGYSSDNTDCDDADNTVHTPQLYYVDGDGDGYGSTTTAMLCSSTAPGGYATNNTDCDDANAAINSPVTYYVDGDGDGYGSSVTGSYCQLTAPVGYSTDNTDCDDADAAVHTGMPYYADADGDGYGAGSIEYLCSATAPAGYSADGTDCDDADNTVHTPQLYYVDGDGDGYGSTTTAMLCSSTAPAGYSTDNTDCDDTNAAIHVNGDFYTDADGDGYGTGLLVSVCYSGTGTPAGYSTDNTDCDDADAVVHTPQLYYVDGDGDGYGSATTAMLCSATAPAGYSADNTDCDDADADVYPGATEVCNGVDDDCDASVDEDLTLITYYADADGDTYGDATTSTTTCSATPPSGYVTNATDCNDADAAVHTPQAYYADGDGDGYGAGTASMVCSATAPMGYTGDNTDCNDASAAVHPGATEVCNGVDDDCDASVDEDLTLNTYYADADGDTYGDGGTATTSCSATAPSGYVSNADDCDDTDSSVNPDGTEVCNGLDDDCDGDFDEGTVSASITPSGSVTVCKSSTTPLTANSGVGYTYQWFRNGHIIPGATGSVYNAVKQGNYTVQVNSAGGCFATSAVTKIIFLPAVNANITTPNGTDLCVATNVKLKASAQPGYTWQWYRNGNPLAGQTNYLLNVTMTSFGPGNYKCLITNSSGCSGFTPTVSVTHPCREGEENLTLTAEADMEIYPNPTSAAFTLDMTVPGVADGVADITVYNMMGQQVMQLTEAVSDAHMMRTITFDNPVTVGVYFVKVLVNGTEYTQQVVLVR